MDVRREGRAQFGRLSGVQLCLGFRPKKRAFSAVVRKERERQECLLGKWMGNLHLHSLLSQTTSLFFFLNSPFPNRLDTLLSSLVYSALLSQTTCLHPVGFLCHDVTVRMLFRT